MIFSRRKSTLSEKDTESGISPAEPQVHGDHDGRPQFAADNQLELFRHLVGINSHPSMVHSHFDSAGRPATNLGIYARVVNSESKAKIGYKYFSWLINACLGLQIVVAAALTAMGAAGASRSAVTVFGAINTVIAGFLAFLKGSGLPNRLKYFQTEWRGVREFIEQRERDFSRPNCDLDVHGVVTLIETMYEQVKMDLEASTPDRFTGAGSARKAQPAETINIKPVQLDLPRLGQKVKEMGSTFGLGDDESAHRQRDINRNVGDAMERIETNFNNVKDLASNANNIVQDFKTQRQGSVESVSQPGSLAAKDFKT